MRRLGARRATPHHPTARVAATAFIGSFIGLGGLAFGQQYLRLAGVSLAAGGGASPTLLVGSFGALATLLYAAPAAPLGKPKNVSAACRQTHTRLSDT